MSVRQIAASCSIFSRDCLTSNGFGEAIEACLRGFDKRFLSTVDNPTINGNIVV